MERTRDRVLNDGEIILLWNALDLENKKPFDVYPLTKLALKMILLTGQRPGEVAGMERKEIIEREDGTWWEIPAERMKGKNAKAHDLRRTCRTGLASLKVSDIVAEKVLFHSLQGVLRVYNKAAYEPERSAAFQSTCRCILLCDL